MSKSLISQVFDNFINTFTQLNNVKENETSINLKNMILDCMLTNIKKFPQINKTYPLFLLEKNLGSSAKSINQIKTIKDLFSLYSTIEDKTILTEMISKIIRSFEDIDSYEIMQTCIWALSYYSSDFSTLKTVFDLIMKNLGDLEFEYVDVGTKSIEEKNSTEIKSAKKTITKILNDYNIDFIYHWLKTNNYKTWLSEYDPQLSNRSIFVKKADNVTIDYENGDTYIGSLSLGKRNGNGVYTESDGHFVYNGEWENDMKNGTGSLTSEDSKYIYDGEWKNDKKHGNGQLVNNTIKYSGGFIE